MTAVLLFGGWIAVQSRAGFFFREQPDYVLDPAQKKALARIDVPVEIDAFVSGNPRLRRGIRTVVERLERDVATLTLRFVDPDTHPVAVQKENITREGQLLIRIGARKKRIDLPSATRIVETLLELQGTREDFIVHIIGNGERDFLADSGGSWRALYQALRAPGANIAAVDLEKSAIPDNTALVVIADPDPEIPAAQERKIAAYLTRGGNLIYSTDTLHPGLPSWLARLSGLETVPGVIVDKAARMVGYTDPRMLPAKMNADNPLTAAPTAPIILPGAVALRATAPSVWQRIALLESSAASWAERGPVKGHIAADAEEARGPLTPGWLLQRDWHGRPQYLLILGDSDLWVGNALSLGGNRAFARSVFSSFAGATGGSRLARPEHKDQFIRVSITRMIWLGICLLVLLPLALIFFTWRLRQRFLNRYRL